MSEPPTARQRNMAGSNSNGNGRNGGYVPMEEEYYQHSGVRGGKSCCLCILIFVLWLMAVANALVTAGLCYFLSITHEGMASVEFFTGKEDIRVLSDLEVDTMLLHQNIIGRRDKDVEIGGEHVIIQQGTESKVEVQGNHTVVTSKEFKLQTSDGKPLLSTDTALNLDLYQVKNLHAPAIDVGSVTSRDKFPDLHIESYHKAEIVGTEGVNIKSGDNTEVTAGQEVIIGHMDNEVIVKSGDGVYLSSSLPLEGKQPDLVLDVAQYKLCICANSGKLFAVRETGQDNMCSHGNQNTHPCAQS